MKIYCFINGYWVGDPGDLRVTALCEDGHFLAWHISSSESFAKYDIGITSERQHDKYKEHCPDGYELVWCDDLKHDGLQVAYDRHLELFPEESRKAGKA